MPKKEFIDRSRRALLGGSGALVFAAALRPWRAKLRIGIIGSGHIGGTIPRRCGSRSV
jgi:hypothetical protein